MSARTFYSILSCYAWIPAKAVNQVRMPVITDDRNIPGMCDSGDAEMTAIAVMHAMIMLRKKMAGYYCFFLTFPTITQRMMVMSISGRVLPTGRSMRIRQRYRTKPMTQRMAFCTFSLSAVWSFFRMK